MGEKRKEVKKGKRGKTGTRKRKEENRKRKGNTFNVKLYFRINIYK